MDIYSDPATATWTADRYRMVIQVLPDRQTAAFRCSDTRYWIHAQNT